MNREVFYHSRQQRLEWIVPLGQRQAHPELGLVLQLIPELEHDCDT